MEGVREDDRRRARVIRQDRVAFVHHKGRQDDRGKVQDLQDELSRSVRIMKAIPLSYLALVHLPNELNGFHHGLRQELHQRYDQRVHYESGITTCP